MWLPGTFMICEQIYFITWNSGFTKGIMNVVLLIYLLHLRYDIHTNLTFHVIYLTFSALYSIPKITCWLGHKLHNIPQKWQKFPIVAMISNSTSAGGDFCYVIAPYINCQVITGMMIASLQQAWLWNYMNMKTQMIKLNNTVDYST